MAASRWIDAPRRAGEELLRDLRGLRGNERLAVIGVAVVTLSLYLPWYGVPFADNLVQTGFGSFNWATGAVLLTGLATIMLSLRVAGGYVPPKPLREWALFVAAGAWMALVLGYLMIERPEARFEFDPVTVERTYDVRYGIFVALAGCALIIAAGARTRVVSSPPRSPS